MPFAAMPGIPPEGLTDGEVLMYAAVKQNIEQLTGQSGDNFSVAITKGAITVEPLTTLQARSVNYRGSAYTISNVQVAPATELAGLATTVQQCINDITNLTNRFNTLVAQLKG